MWSGKQASQVILTITCRSLVQAWDWPVLGSCTVWEILTGWGIQLTVGVLLPVFLACWLCGEPDMQWVCMTAIMSTFMLIWLGWKPLDLWLMQHWSFCDVNAREVHFLCVMPHSHWQIWYSYTDVQYRVAVLSNEPQLIHMCSTGWQCFQMNHSWYICVVQGGSQWPVSHETRLNTWKHFYIRDLILSSEREWGMLSTGHSVQSK